MTKKYSLDYMKGSIKNSTKSNNNGQRVRSDNSQDMSTVTTNYENQTKIFLTCQINN